MDSTKYILLIILLFLTLMSNAQKTDTLFFDQQGELIIKEVAAIYRIADFDTINGNIINEFRDFNLKNDSILGVGEVIINSDSLQEICMFIGSLQHKEIAKKMLMLKSSFVRKNDYPHLKKFIKPYKTNEERIKTEDSNFIIIELKPEFPGGMETLGWFIGQFIKYPVNAQENNISGIVRVGITVETDGTLNNIHIISGIGYGCDEEAIRVLKLIPDWLPALQRGKPFKTNIQLPINFE